MASSPSVFSFFPLLLLTTYTIGAINPHINTLLIASQSATSTLASLSPLTNQLKSIYTTSLPSNKHSITCTNSPCRNNSVCSIIDHEVFCGCKSGFEGRFCQFESSDFDDLKMAFVNLLGKMKVVDVVDSEYDVASIVLIDLSTPTSLFTDGDHFEGLFGVATKVFELSFPASQVESRDEVLKFVDCIVEALHYLSRLIDVGESAATQKTLEDEITRFQNFRGFTGIHILPRVTLGAPIYWYSDNLSVTYQAVDLDATSSEIVLTLRQGDLWKTKGIDALWKMPQEFLAEVRKQAAGSVVTLCFMSWAKNIWNRLHFEEAITSEYISSVLSLAVFDYQTTKVLANTSVNRFDVHLPIRGWSEYYVQTVNKATVDLIQAGRIGCGSFVFNSRTWDTSRCTLTAIRDYTCICSCGVMGDVGSQFFSSAKGVAESANYNVLTQPEAMSDVEIASWSGFWFVLVYSIMYIIVVGWMIMYDKARAGEMTWEEKLTDYRMIYLHQLERKVKNDKSKVGSDRYTDVPALNVMWSHSRIIGTHSDKDESAIDPTGTAIETARGSISFKKYLGRVDSDEDDSKHVVKVDKDQTVGSYLKAHLVNHHALLYPFTVFNYGSPRHIRISLLFFAVLLQISTCALFYNVEEGDASSLSTWEQVWIAIYSALIVSIGMYLVCSIFIIPSSILERAIIQIHDVKIKMARGATIQGQKDAPQIDFEYMVHRIDRQIKRRYCMAYCLYVLATLFFLYYILVFTAVYTKKTNMMVLFSWMGSFVFDMGLLEFIPGLLGTMLLVLELAIYQKIVDEDEAPSDRTITKLRLQLERSKRFRKLFV